MATTQVGNVIFSISADLKQLQGQLRTMEGNFQSSFARIEGAAKSALGTFGIGLSGAALVAFGKQVIDLAGHLDDLSKQTGISVQTLSGIKSTLEENGSSVDSFAKAVFNLQKNLGNVDQATDPAAKAIKALGLNLQELRNTDTETFVSKVVTALGKVENPVQRAAIASNLLSKSARELIPAFLELAGKFDELRAKGMNEDTVKRLDEIGDALTRVKNQALLLGGEGAVALLKFFGVIPAAPVEQLGQLDRQIENITKQISVLSNIPAPRLEGMQRGELFKLLRDPGVSEGAKRLVNDLISLRDRQEEVASTFRKPAPAKQQFKEMGDTAKKSLDGFLESLQKQADQLRINIVQLGSGQEAALELGLAFQFAEFRAKLLAEGKIVPPDAEKKFTALKEEIVGLSRSLAQAKLDSDLLKQSLDELDKTFPEPGSEDVSKALPPGLVAQSGGILSEDQFKDLKSQQEQMAKFEHDLTLALIPESARRAAIINDEYDERVKKIREAYEQGVISEEKMTELVTTADAVRLEALKQQTDETTKFLEHSWERIGDAIGNAFQDLLSGQIKTARDFAKRIVKVFTDILAEYLAMQAKIAILGPKYGAPGPGGQQVGGLLGQIIAMISGEQQTPDLNAPGTIFTPGGAFPQAPYAYNPYTGARGDQVPGATPPAPSGFAAGGPGLGGGGLMGGSRPPWATPPFFPDKGDMCCADELGGVLRDVIGKGIPEILKLFGGGGGGGDLWEGTLAAFDRLDMEAGTVGDNFQDLAGLFDSGKSSIQSFQDSLINAASDVGDWASSLAEMFSGSDSGGAFDGGGGGFSSLFGSTSLSQGAGTYGGAGNFLSSADTTFNVAGEGSSIFANVFHGGGIAGQGGPRRMMDARLFIGAPRYHMGSRGLGLRQNEVPAILEKGERIVPRGGNASAQNITVINNIRTDDFQSFHRNRNQLAADSHRALTKAAQRLGNR